MVQMGRRSSRFSGLLPGRKWNSTYLKLDDDQISGIRLSKKVQRPPRRRKDGVLKRRSSIGRLTSSESVVALGDIHARKC